MKVFLSIIRKFTEMFKSVTNIIDHPTRYLILRSGIRSVYRYMWYAAKRIEISLKISTLFLEGSWNGLLDMT
jgi:hypothetical protein